MGRLVDDETCRYMRATPSVDQTKKERRPGYVDTKRDAGAGLQIWCFGCITA